MTERKRVIIAPDSFKGSASALDVARAIAAGWLRVRPADDVRLMPMADGGEGTLDAFEAAVAGSVRRPVVVRGPDDRAVHASWLLLPTGAGVVELAATSGITLLDPLRPLDAHTIGFGEAIASALDAGVDRLVLAIGGSSSTDGGVGALTALGARFLDEHGRPIPPGNRGLAQLASIDLSALRPLPEGGAQILSDVTSPLTGLMGAAHVFGPQKGADALDVTTMDANLAHFAEVLKVADFGSRQVADPLGADAARLDPDAPGAGAARLDADAPGAGAAGLDADAPGAGAAGGTGFGLLAWGATMAPGAGAVATALGMQDALADADLLITGEGRFDEQSAAGKVPSYLADCAATVGIPAYLVAGSIRAATDRFDASVELSELAGGADAAIREPARYLFRAGELLAGEAGVRR